MICTMRVRNAKFLRWSTSASSVAPNGSKSIRGTSCPVMAEKTDSKRMRCTSVSPSGGDTAEAIPLAVAAVSSHPGGTRSVSLGVGSGIGTTLLLL